MEEVQQLWEAKRTERSEIHFPKAIERLDKNKDVSKQDLRMRYLVLYNARGANAMVYVLDRENMPPIYLNENSWLDDRVFVADYTTYYFPTSDPNEAHYLSAVLNSSVINKRVKPFQPRGKYGKRDIGIRPFMLSIPKFDENNSTCIKLAGISKDCHKKISNHKFNKTGFKSMRNEAIRILGEEIAEIDACVKIIVR